MATSSSETRLTVDVAIDSLFMLFCVCLLSCMVLGMSVFYAGLIQRRSSFTILSIPILISAGIFLDWFIWGYSLCYGSSSNRFIGNLKFAVLRQLRDPEQRVYETPRGEILSIMHFLFNGLLKIVCTVITFPGCTAERGRLVPMFVFIACWSVIIYNPVSYWYWNKNGWLSTQLDKIPVMDFAGGTCIHVVSGFTALAYSYILGPRNPTLVANYRSSSNGNMIIGMCLLLMGWCGFVSGCDYKLSSTTFYIIVNTWLSACTAGIVWMLIDFYTSAIPLEFSDEQGIELQDFSQDGEQVQSLRDDTVAVPRKISMVSLTSGVVCGLVVFTPGGGYISSHTSFWKSIVFGVVGGIVGNLSTRIKYYLKIDDALDIFAVHGVCGIAGTIMVGIFADDAFGSNGGWVAGNWKQIGYQILGCVVTAVYSFVVSLVLLYIIDMVPGLHLRIDKTFNARLRKRLRDHQDSEDGDILSIEDENLEKAELLGSDWYEFNGEYFMDFMEFIKVVDPDDYNEQIVAENISPRDSELSHFERPDGRLRKRDILFDEQS